MKEIIMGTFMGCMKSKGKIVICVETERKSYILLRGKLWGPGKDWEPRDFLSRAISLCGTSRRESIMFWHEIFKR